MKKKLIVLVSVLLLLSLSACGGNQSPSTEPKVTKTESTVQEKTNLTPVPTSIDKKTNSGTFTNKFGTATTKCAHAGCDNYIASSGDTNCCTIHSNRCLECKKYIDEDAMYCMDCLTKASKKASNDNGSSNNGSKNNSYSQKSDNIGAGGYEMPNEDDESFSDYVKRVDPDLYDELFSEGY